MAHKLSNLQVVCLDPESVKFLSFQIKTFKMSWKGTSIWAHMPIGNTHPQILSRNFYVMFCKEKYRFIFQFCIFCIHMLWPRDKCCSHLPSCPKYRCTDTTIKKTPSPQKPLHFSVLKGRENMRVPVSGSFSHRFELELFCF